MYIHILNKKIKPGPKVNNMLDAAAGGAAF
jgi:hypothetical protein